MPYSSNIAATSTPYFGSCIAFMAPNSSNNPVRATISSLFQAIQSQCKESYMENIQAYEEYIRALDAALADVRKAITIEAATAAKKRNNLVPIHQLPKELFTQILQQSLPNIKNTLIGDDFKHYTKQYYRRVYRLREVSSAWNLAVDYTPTLWTAISSACHPQVLSNALVRSAKAPLHLTLSETTRVMMFQPQNMVDICSTFLAQVGPTISRWSFVLFHLPGTSRAMVEEHLTKPAPLVESVRISLGASMDGEGAVDLFGGQAGHLKDLTLQSFPMRWESPILRGVENLKIGGTGLALRLSQLLAILSDNRRLKQLSFSTAEMQMDVSAPTERKIHLSLMEELSFSIPGDVADILLKSIDIPVCRNLRLEIDMRNFARPQFLNGVMLHFRSRICESIIRSSKSEVKVMDISRGPLLQPWSIPGKGTRTAPKLFFIFFGCSAESMWSWIEEVHLGLPNKVDLVLADQDLDERVSAIERMARSPVVGSLYLSEDGAYYPTALELLSRALPADAGTGGRRGFPYLTHVSTCYREFIDLGLKVALEKRYKGCVDIRGGRVERPPGLKLNFITMSGEPDFDNARLFIGMDGISMVEVDGTPVLE
ncbi:hypothetical protein FRC00_007909 [Tulasnella sp. 408]|nr:hypothetical protein FRC00_007909 [Tulasnella sp. 408]